MFLELLASLAPAGPPAGDFEARVLPLLRAHCIECHSGPDAKGELDLGAFADEKGARAKPETWKLVRARVAAGEMPPRKKPRLAPEALVALTGSYRVLARAY